LRDEITESKRRPLVEDRLGERARVYGTEQAVLVGIDGVGEQDLLSELESLADTAGIPTLATVIQRRNRPDPATFIGKGKVDEVRIAAEEVGADVVIFNDELSSGQARNLEDALGRKVIDRTQLILDIFAQRATSKEAKLQVELAQLRYLLPRLRGWGQALTQTGGGIGTRGPGETQLEIDREKVRRRIHGLERRLRKAGGERAVRRKRRSSSDLAQVALVGYTNSGKSTLLNRLAGAESLVENKLFATLDTVVRRAELRAGRSVLFIDTVGFIRDLPHNLVPAFAATLEAARYADLILHIVDGSKADVLRDYRSVLDTLEEEVFGDEDVRPPILNVLNKSDLPLAPGSEAISGVRISARQGVDLDLLEDQVMEILYPGDEEVDLTVPYGVVGKLPMLRGSDRARDVVYAEEAMKLRISLSPAELLDVRSQGCTATPVASSLAGGASPGRP
jgi:GTP-binding protein HflX